LGTCNNAPAQGERVHGGVRQSCPHQRHEDGVRAAQTVRAALRDQQARRGGGWKGAVRAGVKRGGRQEGGQQPHGERPAKGGETHDSRYLGHGLLRRREQARGHFLRHHPVRHVLQVVHRVAFGPHFRDLRHVPSELDVALRPVQRGQFFAAGVDHVALAEEQLLGGHAAGGLGRGVLHRPVLPAPAQTGGKWGEETALINALPKER